VVGLVLALGWWEDNGRRPKRDAALATARFTRPLVGPLQARYAMARFCRMLGTLVEAGVPLIAALRVACDSLGNQTLIDAVAGSIEKVKKGSGLAVGLRDCPEVFPNRRGNGIRGGRDGPLGNGTAARRSSHGIRVGSAIAHHGALVEPLMLFVMAAFIVPSLPGWCFRSFHCRST